MFDVLLAVLALAPAPVAGFPLDEGLRWTYDYLDYERVTVDVVGTNTIEEKEVSVLTVVGEWLFTHDGGDIYVTSGDGGFAVHGSRFERYDEPLVFVQPPLKVGAKWHSETIGRRPYGAREMAFDATVLARETITVPAGEFDAWKIGINNDRDAPATPRDFTAWFVPDVGFVRYEYRYNSYPWRGFLDSPIVCQLKEFGKLPYGYPIEYSELVGQQQSEAKRLLASLRSDDTELNQPPHQALVKLGPGVIPVLLEALDKEQVANRRLRVQNLLQEFATIEIVAFTNRPSARVGEPLPVEFRIRNVGCAPIPVAPALDKSDLGRFPAYTIEVHGPDGQAVDVVRTVGCANTNPLRERDVVILQPGEELNPFSAPGFSHYMLYRWSPEKPGTYTVRCIYEAGVGGDAAKGNPYFRWNMWPPTPVLLSLIHRMPHGRILSNEVSVVVEE